MAYYVENDEELDLTALEIDDLDWAVERVGVNFGNGYGAEAVLGSPAGLHVWRLSSTVLADDASYNDPVESLPSFQYYFDFIQRKLGGNESAIFMLTFRGKRYHASFVNPGFNAGMLTIDLFSMGGVEVRQRRSQYSIYNADGSVFYPTDVSDLTRWYTAEYFEVNEVVADGATLAGEIWPNRITDAVTIQTSATGVTLETNEVNGLPCLRFDGVDGNVFNTGGLLGGTHIFIVMKVREATWSGNDNWFIGDGTNAMLKSSNGTTKFADQGFSNFTYKLNGVTYAQNNQQCPMNEWGLVEFRKSDGFSMGPDYFLVGDDVGNTPLADVAEIRICGTLPSDDEATLERLSLMRKYNLSA